MRNNQPKMYEPMNDRRKKTERKGRPGEKSKEEERDK
jgi:hypothetical protein